MRKRLFEVADAALSAFCRAEAAIAHAREPTLVAGEGATRKRGDHELPAYSGLLDRLYIQLREPLRAYQRIAVATACRMSNVGLSAQAKVNPALIRRWEAVVYAGARYGADPDEIDQLSIDMDEAGREVDAVLRPYVEAPTFSEFLVRQNVRESISRHLGSLPWLLRHRDRSGYGKIAVYASAPLTEGDHGWP